MVLKVQKKQSVLEYILPHSAHKPLGHYDAPSGNQLPHYQVLPEESNMVAVMWDSSICTVGFYYCALPHTDRRAI